MELLDPSNLATLFLLIGLELVLGIDNLLLISILSDRLPKDQRLKARFLGLSIALVTRILLVLGASFLVQLTDPVFFGRSWKDLILLAGGAFLMFKAVKEIHHAVENPTGAQDVKKGGGATMFSVVLQILLLDIVFSVDSVITAVGLTDKLWVIESAVILSFVLLLFFSGHVTNFIQSNPALKVLALS